MSGKSIEKKRRIATKKGLLPCYLDSIGIIESKERYVKKMKLIDARDPYEIPRDEWDNDVEKLLPPAVKSITSNS